MSHRSRLMVFVLGVSCLVWGVSRVMSQAQSANERRAAAQMQMNNGNFRDAYELFQKLCLDPKAGDKEISGDLRNAVQCLQQLGRLGEIDNLLESTIAAHPKNWRLLQTAAEVYLQIDHLGFRIGGTFERGPHRGGGEIVNSLERDRTRALQLLVRAMPLVNEEPNKPEVAAFYGSLADHILYDRGSVEAWRLQYLTNLNELPDYDEGYVSYRDNPGAPVDEENNPIYHRPSENWESAESDGQRWRWALEQEVENDPSRRNSVRVKFASFLRQQFGVETLAHGPIGIFWGEDDDDQDREAGIFALDSLSDEETIARLASGIKRFELPDEFNFIKILQQVVEESKLGSGEEALGALADIFENRRQYPRAAEYWKRSIELYGPGQENWKQKRLDQIVGNWGRFEPTSTLPAGGGATFEFLFRNATAVEFEAYPIKVDKLLNDIKSYLKSRPRQLDWEKMNIPNIGWQLVQGKAKEYLGERVATWKEELKPREKHFDRRVTITSPLRKAGAYYVTARVQGGNAAHMVLWVADSIIVKKPVTERTLYYVADALSGTPIPDANVEFFGWKQVNDRRGRFHLETTNFAEKTNAEGQVLTDNATQSPEFQWLVVARGREGRMAFLGFHGVWTGKWHDQQYNEVKTYVITDRPVYRPGQKVDFKVWIRRAQYDREEDSEFAQHSLTIEILDPRGQKSFTTKVETDKYGGASGEFELPSETTLGMYQLQVAGYGGGSFRVEEYKKPEFEVVVDSPSEPVMLGEKIAAKVTAKYYFGSPVTSATVKYKVQRTIHNQHWFPVRPWDWCYGPGYWWFSYDYPWYPGWSKWVGSVRPVPIWFPRNMHPPELVAENEVPIGPDGVVEIEIDTAIAQAIHSDHDHQYEITAEVRDESRRTIVGQGKVLVARQPFKVFSWVDRGYYRVGDTIRAHFMAQTIDDKPVQGTGTLKLLKVDYDKERQPVETEVEEWKLDTNDQGLAVQQVKAAEPGQYRLSYHVTDSAEHTIEGGYLFTVMGTGMDPDEFRFNDLELIQDKEEYQPDEKVKLQINTDRANSTVLLFIRPANGVYLPPKTIRLKGKTAIEEIAVIKKDMPNFFVEAVTISQGRVHTEMREIVVPPEKRVLNVEVLPSEAEYKPGEKGKVRIRLTDFFGENFTGSTALSIYDKSVEYVSGGSNVPDIKKFFWEWRRQHHPHDENSLIRHSDNVYDPNQPPMAAIGVFGHTVPDTDDARMNFAMGGMGGGFGGMRPMGLARGAKSLMAMDGAPAPMSAALESAEGAQVAGFADAPQAAELVQPSIRSNFADTALWVGSLTTDKTGVAEVDLTMPENLTTWKVRLWGMGHGTRVGSGEAEFVTRKNLILRLQAPRFFVQKDEVVLSANVHNYLSADKEVTVSLELPGNQLEALGPTTVKVRVPADGEERVDWRVKVKEEGLATVRMKALTDEESDAMEMKLPCIVHGMLKTESWAGTVRPDEDVASVTMRVPHERRVPQSILEVRYSPTLAGAMVDALPYLVEYPYGCTEQTLNRFLPTVITHKTLLEMNLNLEEIRDKRTNLNAQEVGDDQERAKQWKRFDRNPVFDMDEVNKMVKEGVTALTNMQVSDGGWGWFSGWGEQSFPHTTALVVHGLQIAKQNDVPIVPGVIERGVEWLSHYQQEQVELLKKGANEKVRHKKFADNLDAFVHMVLVESGSQTAEEEMREFLYRDRTHLAVYAKAMFGLALHKLEDQKKLDMILQNIRQYQVDDEENETAYLQLPENNYWWMWYGSEVEANAYYLKLLAKTDPNGESAPRLVKYLLNNRKHATYWNSTRDTAICIEAFAEYIRASGEAQPEMTVELWLDGEMRKAVEITGENLFTYDNKFVLTGEELTDGEHKLEIRRQGKGPVYFNAYLANFTLEDPITKAGLEIKVSRQYYRLVPVDKEVKVAGSRGQAVDQQVEKYERQPLADGDQVKSGDLLEIELMIESKNDYEYLVFEDMKAAGCEPFDVRSGYNSKGLFAYMELRDDRVSLFVRTLARGKHSLRYRMRAEIPGRFSALPTQGYAMYAPELRGNSDEDKLQIVDE